MANNYYITPGSYRFGTQGDDLLDTYQSEILIGLDGDDTLTSSGLITGLAGGNGNDDYRVGAAVTTVTDAGGQDAMTLSGHADDYMAGILDGQHLILVDAWTGQTTVVADFKGAGRIETFSDSYGNHYSAGEVENLAYDTGLGNIDAQTVLNLSGDTGIDVATFRAAMKLDQAFGQLDWAGVFERVGSVFELDNATLTEAIRAEAFERVDGDTQARWDEFGIQQALTNSTYSGVEANLPDGTMAGQGVASNSKAEEIALLYAAALDRQPDHDGLNYWLDQFEQGMTAREIGKRFLASDEFQSRFDVENDQDFITQLYANVLDRTPDSSGETYWLGELDNGKAPTDVLLGFSNSDENRVNAGDWLSGLQTDNHQDWWIA